jgi:hypothetical protein
MAVILLDFVSCFTVIHLIFPTAGTLGMSRVFTQMGKFCGGILNFTGLLRSI